MSLDSPNPYLPSENYFTERYESQAHVETNWGFKTAEIGPHAIYINLDEIASMWLAWHTEGDNKNQPKNWQVKYKSNGAVETFTLALGWKIFQALKRYKGQVDA